MHILGDGKGPILLLCANHQGQARSNRLANLPDAYPGQATR